MDRYVSMAGSRTQGLGSCPGEKGCPDADGRSRSATTSTSRRRWPESAEDAYGGGRNGSTGIARYHEGWHVGGPHSSSRRAIASLRSDQPRCASVMLSNKVSVSEPVLARSCKTARWPAMISGIVRHHGSAWPGPMAGPPGEPG